MKRLCTICARGGSKGLPRKNVRPLLGKPLIAWTVEQAIHSGQFLHIAVSSDDDEILRVAGQAGATLLIRRPAELATDEISKLPAITHAIRDAEAQLGLVFDTVVELDATSPLRSVTDIVDAIGMMESGTRSNVITGAPARRSPYFNLVELDEQGNAFVSKNPSRSVVRRQEAPRSFDMNASIYVWRRDLFLENPSVFYPDTGLFEMPEDRSHDIDSQLDFQFVEMLLRKRAGNPYRFMDAYDLTGRVAVVTGAAGILGKRFCLALAEAGATLVAVDTENDALEGLVSFIRQTSNVTVHSFVLDVSDSDAVRATVGLIEDTIGAIDILHNNAATKGKNLSDFFVGSTEFDPALWREVMDVNVAGYFFMAREVGARMAQRGRGSIIQTGSIYGSLGPDQRIYEGSEYLGMPINTPAVYSASKAAVIGLTNYLATLWGKDGVRVNTLTPGGVSSGQNARFENSYSQRIPLARMAKADEIAHGLLFLASDASSYVSGHNLIVDGGLHAW